MQRGLGRAETFCIEAVVDVGRGERYQPEQVVNLPRQVEVAVANA